MIDSRRIFTETDRKFRRARPNSLEKLLDHNAHHIDIYGLADFHVKFNLNTVIL